MQDIRKIKIQAVPKNIELLKKLADFRVPALKSETTKTNTAQAVKYSIQELSPDKIQKGEIDPLKIDPNVYEVFSRNSAGQLLLDLNQDNQNKRYTINLQTSKFEDLKFNEIIDIEFEEFLPTRSFDDIIAELQQEIERLKVEKSNLEEQIKADKRLELELRKDINESTAEIERLELVIENARVAASATQRVEQASKELESTKKEPRTAFGRVVGKLFCYAQGTPILMEDSTFKEIQDLRVGDIVAGGGRVLEIAVNQNVSELAIYKNTVMSVEKAVFTDGQFAKVFELPETNIVPNINYIPIIAVVTENHILVTDTHIGTDITFSNLEIEALNQRSDLLTLQQVNNNLYNS